jgi:hypothetical protein
VLTDLRQQKPEVIFHGGDISYGGCNPCEVIDCVIQEGWQGGVGNTDEMLWDASARARLEASAPKLALIIMGLSTRPANLTNLPRSLPGQTRLYRSKVNRAGLWSRD